MIALLRFLAVLTLAVVPLFAAEAHDARPVLVSIVQQTGSAFMVRVVTPPSVPTIDIPTIRLPAGCRQIGEPAVPSYTIQAIHACPQGLGGKSLTITYPKFNPSLSTMVRVAWSSGETRTLVAPPEDRSIAIPSPETVQGVSAQYFRLGVEHILTGYDHLLFLACLLLIAGTWRRILIVVTGFTLAHSVTLALAALRLVTVPVPPVEAAIALSILFLATEIARGRRRTLTWRYPILVSSSFGFLHGFGFAAALGEVGMPQTEVPAALLFFNVGVEAGQLMFIAVIAAAVFVVQQLLFAARVAPERLLASIERPAAYLVGSLSAFWMFDRLWAFFPSA